MAHFAMKCKLTYKQAVDLQKVLTEFIHWSKTDNKNDDLFILYTLSESPLAYEFSAYQEDGGVNLKGDL